MRILKIELQNINSLKSDTPVVIDFEKDMFKDTGLFAITGATGSGKTTILDALSIALYQNVPRFQKSKGTLLDVVSYGAKSAFCRVSFENNQKVYEAYWGVELVNKTGKKLKNPKEEVRLKDITDGNIIATQKRKMLDAVEEVTQLSYEQFLRSVMLAQGEFAAFLSAKASEKGQLLEQITGEEIYKRIGEQILARRNLEEQKLNDLKNALNQEDLLSGEEKTALQKREREIEVEIKDLNKRLEASKSIEKWYKDYRKLVEKQEQLLKDEERYKVFAEQHQEELKLLTVNEEAEQYKPLIDNILRNENTLQDKTTQVQKYTGELKSLEPEIKELSGQETGLTQQVVQAKQLFNNWLPKFEKLTQLETDIKNRLDELEKITKNLQETKNKIVDLQNIKKKLNVKSESLLQITGTLKVYIKQHKFLEKVDTQLTDWTTGLTNLKSQTLQLKEVQQAVAQKQVEIENSRNILREKEGELEALKSGFEALKTKLFQIDKELTAHDMTQLLSQKDKQQEIVEKWKKLVELADKYAETMLKINKLKENSKNIIKQIGDKEDAYKKLLKEIEKQTESVADAQRIYDLQKSIKNYEEERKHLIAGVPCPLCGSTKHPFAEHDTPTEITEAEAELKQRLKVLEVLTENKNKIDTNIKILQYDRKNFNKRISELQTEQQQILSEGQNLKLNAAIDQKEHIDIQYNQALAKLKDVDNQISKARKLQTQKDENTKTFQEQKDRLHQLEKIINTQKEKQKLYQKEIEEKQKLISELKQKIQTAEQTLTPQLSQFGYTLPTAETTETFINSIKENIEKYDSKKETLTGLLSELEKNKIELDNLATQIEQLEKEHEKLQAQQEDISGKIKKIRDKRIEILPFEISISQKRQELTGQRDTLEKKQQETKNMLEEKLALKRKIETLLLQLQKDIASINQDMSKDREILSAQLKASLFDSMQSVRQALLAPETKQQYLKIKKQIDEANIQMATRKEELQNTINQHLTQKTFEINEAENQEKLQVLKTQSETLLSERGEIKEKYRKDAEIRSRNQEITKQIDAQKKVFELWQELYKIIGGSKDAFNVYVQRLTLKQLLDLANIHLYRLNKRYSLQMPDTYKAKEELNFYLIDHYQTGQMRLIETSSGGEKFIISLALALGLSDLSSKNVRIDSLFIDEGFGTLDSDTLETVISSLETLQSQGKIIGIISHVEALKERIARQIRVIKKSNGVSTVEIV